MSAIRSRDTKMELKFRKALFKRGVRYRKNVGNLPGKPDLAIKSKKLAIFLDSCFWHCCPQHFRHPKSNLEYWTSKFIRNKQKDKKVNREYKKMGWKILRFWEHEINKNLDSCVEKVINNL